MAKVKHLIGKFKKKKNFQPFHFEIGPAFHESRSLSIKHVRKSPVTWSSAVVFAGYFFQYLQLAYHDLV